MRYTIPGDAAVHARKIARLNDMTRADWWRTVLRGDRLRGIGNGTDRPVSVHRERVRFGAWEERPSGRASRRGRRDRDLHLFRVRRQREGREYAKWAVSLRGDALLAALRDLGPRPVPERDDPTRRARPRVQTGTGEAPPVSGPENAYKPTWCPTHRTWVDGGNLRCAACGEYHLKFAGGDR